ncbi:MAG: hypothetical protein KTR19_10910 [Hyphomicrobiales bacterium]|nr:hypothetical protein [Hyphomicrobiales bacterium]
MVDYRAIERSARFFRLTPSLPSESDREVQKMGLSVKLTTLATILAFAFITAMILGML